MNSKDMRDAFFDGIYEVVKKDKNVIVLTADHGAFGLSRIEKDYPNQFLNIGIAEQNMISFAAGLAKTGKIVYAYSINNFITLRSLEHVNIDLCGMDLNVNLVGVGAGFTYSTDGPTHQGLQDAQAMSVLPNLQIYNVTDDINSKKLAILGYEKKGPKYFRIEKGFVERHYSDNTDLSDGLSIIRECNSSTLLISTGYMIQVANKVCNDMGDVALLDIFRLKPLNSDKLVNILSAFDNVIVLEEATYSGSLCEKIGYLLAKHSLYKRFLPIAIEDKHCFNYGSRESLHKLYKIDSRSVVRKIKNFLVN